MLGRIKALVIATLKAPSNSVSIRGGKESENQVTMSLTEEYTVVKHHLQRRTLGFHSKSEA